MKKPSFGQSLKTRLSLRPSFWPVWLVLCGLCLVAPPVWAVGTWTNLTAVAGGNINLIFLLPDGTVMGQGTASKQWYKLTPDNRGHYQNGIWTNRQDMAYGRNYFVSQVLQNGKVFVLGAEHPDPVVAGLPAAPPPGNVAELYDPVADSWTNFPVPTTVSNGTRPSAGPYAGYAGFYQSFGAPGSMMLPNGSIMMTPEFPRVPYGMAIYNPANNSFTNGPSAFAPQYEASWVKLPDDSILTIDNNQNNAASTNSERYIPSLNRWIKDANVPVALYGGLPGTSSYEIGAALLLPNGKAFFLGGSGQTAIYTPSGNTNAGTWLAGTSIPGGLGVMDGPAAMMPNGKILCVAGSSSNLNSVANGNYTQASFFEYDPVANSFSTMPCPYALTNGLVPWKACMLDLPDGTVLLSINNTGQLYLYTPDTGPLAASRPVITSVTNTSYKNYLITGTLLNGISQGAAYGDDWQMDGNHPLVVLTDVNTNVYYARTYNWSLTSVMATGVPETAAFTVPSGLTNGIYSVQVSVCGNTSAPVQLAFTNDTMQIIPATSMTFYGPVGGPFSPTQNLTITNTGTVPLSWGLYTNLPSWLLVSTNMGKLAGNTAFTNLAVNIGGAATNFAVGYSSTTLYITNLTSGTIQTVLVKLYVNPIVQNGDFEIGDFSFWTFFGDSTVDYVTYISEFPNYVHSGEFGAFLGAVGPFPPGALYQTVTIRTNQNYLLSLWLDLPAPGSFNQFLVTFGGNLLFSQNFAGAFGWVNLQFVVSSTVTNNVLQFDFQNDTGAFGLDDVSMVPINLVTNGPVITTQPAGQSVMPGQVATYWVGAIGQSPLSYQWSLNNTNMVGATDSSLFVVGATNTTGLYRCTVTNASGSVTSMTAPLTLLPASLVSNGSFQTGDFTGWIVSDTNLVAIGSIKYSGTGLFDSGNYGALLGNSNTFGSLSQFILTQPGQYYLITFTLANNSSALSNVFNVNWNTGGSTTALLNATNVPYLGITTVQLIARADSMATQLQFTFQNLNGYFGLDAISVVPVPLPVLNALAWEDGTTTLSWNSVAGLGYQLQYTTDLTIDDWTDIGELYIGNGGIVTGTDDSAVDPYRFYRLGVSVLPVNLNFPENGF